MATRKGNTLFLDTAPSVISYGAVGSKKESEGPLAAAFDRLWEDSTLGEETWEKAECRLQKEAIRIALEKGELSPKDLQVIFAGDLLNQCTSSTYGLRELGVPFIGLYGACSTMAESLALAALFIEGGFGERAAAITSSHFCSAERQYRTPLEYGSQRTPTAQWTATAAGAVVVTNAVRPGPRVARVTVGMVKDKGIKDANNMGAAMAPAAYETLKTHFEDTGLAPDYYDLIVTGDLGSLGHEIVTDLFDRDGVKLANYNDCGLILFDREEQDVHAGASGCGCSASVLCGYLLPGLLSGRWSRILFCPTGALHSPTATMQGESIPGICHALALEGGK